MPMDEAAVRAHRYRRFEYVRKRFGLVSFADLANWLALESGQLGLLDERRRTLALVELRDAVLTGAFGPEEKLCVAYMPKPVHGTHPGRYPLRLTARIRARSCDGKNGLRK